MKKLKQFLVMSLVVALCCPSIGNYTFASSDLTSEMQGGQVSDDSRNFEAEGTDSAGELLVSAISEEKQTSEKREQSAYTITGLEIEENTAVVEFQTQTDAEIVVAVYDEQHLQMLASGNGTVSKGESVAEITISGDMPQYFVATVYLLDKESHEALCDSYTTELYTKDIQDLRNSIVDDYDAEKVLQFDDNDTTTNFAVFNEETTIANEGDMKNHLTDNGDGTYTITNASSSFTELKVGGTFSYNYEDGTVLLVKAADISVNGTTVTVREDTNADLNDYFDYVKIEADGSQGSWSIDNSKLEEGVMPADTENQDVPSDGDSRTGGSGSSQFSISYDLNKEFDNKKKINLQNKITLH